jgi:membrane-associated phospholipid phosphatase
VHYPLDIVIGAIMGVFSGWMAWYALKKIKRNYLREIGVQKRNSID